MTRHRIALYAAQVAVWLLVAPVIWMVAGAWYVGSGDWRKKSR